MTEPSVALREWRKLYIKACIDELRPKSDILEIGFAHAIAAEFLQTHALTSHTIIESDPEILQKAYAWASKHSNVVVINEAWENALPKLKTFDAIFFNNAERQTDLPSLKRIQQAELSFATGAGEKLYKEIEQEFVKIKVQFSNKEIDDFYETIGKFNFEALPEFLLKLVENANISQEQYENALKKYHIEPKKKEPKVLQSDPSDTLLSVLMQCINHNMHKGSRFSCYMPDATSRFSDSRFFEKVIVDPNLDYHEKIVPITVPDVCEYDALIMVVEKLV